MSQTTNPRDRWLWGLLALALLTVGVAWAWTTWSERAGASSTDSPPQMPDFTLTERSGQTVRLADLLGRPWVADFIFTRCAGPCPIMSARMADLQREFAGCGVRFVSFTLDPTHDSPEILAEYAKRFDAHPEQWLFLTGDENNIHALATQGLQLSARRATEEERTMGSDTIIHSTRFVLMDSQGWVKGRFVGTDDQQLNALRDALRELCKSSEE